MCFVVLWNLVLVSFRVVRSRSLSLVTATSPWIVLANSIRGCTRRKKVYEITTEPGSGKITIIFMAKDGKIKFETFERCTYEN